MCYIYIPLTDTDIESSSIRTQVHRRRERLGCFQPTAHILWHLHYRVSPQILLYVCCMVSLDLCTSWSLCLASRYTRYVGELVDVETARQRMISYDQQGLNYLLIIREEAVRMPPLLDLMALTCLDLRCERPLE